MTTMTDRYIRISDMRFSVFFIPKGEPKKMVRKYDRTAEQVSDMFPEIDIKRLFAHFNLKKMEMHNVMVDIEITRTDIT